MGNKPDHFSDITLERFVLGELPGPEMKVVEGALTQDTELKNRVKDIRLSNQMIISKYSPKEMAEAFKAKLHLKNVKENYLQESDTKKKKNLFLAGLGLPKFMAALAILAFLLVPISLTLLVRERDTVSEIEITRIKGHKPVLNIYKKSPGGGEGAGDGFQKLSAENSAREGDIIQMGYVAAGKKYGTIFSVDGKGAFTLHFPLSEKSIPLLKGNRENLLTEAYELDDAPFFEKFFFVTSQEKMDLFEVLSAGRAFAKKLSVALEQGPEIALKKISGPVLSQKYHQETFFLRKGKP